MINDGNYYLLGYADDIEAVRTYRIDRMRDVSLLDEHRDLYRDLSTHKNMKAYIRQTFSMFGGEQEKVTIRFENSLLDTVIDKFGVGFGAEYVPDEEDHFAVTTNVAVSDQFYAWICGFGTKAKIVAPGKVVKAFGKYLADIQQQYR